MTISCIDVFRTENADFQFDKWWYNGMQWGYSGISGGNDDLYPPVICWLAMVKMTHPSNHFPTTMPPPQF